MSDPKNIDLTRAERATAKLRQRFDNHIQLWWQTYSDDKKYSREYTFIIADKPHELWRCDFCKVNAEETAGPDKPLWFLWNKKEVTSYDNLDDAIVDFVTEKKEARIKSKLQYYTSPLAISAILAILLICLIFLLMYRRDAVPAQLWTVFTAVIAFYFGRKDTRASSAD